METLFKKPLKCTILSEVFVFKSYFDIVEYLKAMGVKKKKSLTFNMNFKQYRDSFAPQTKASSIKGYKLGDTER